MQLSHSSLYLFLYIYVPCISMNVICENEDHLTFKCSEFKQA
jgi:hypothetical protein